MQKLSEKKILQTAEAMIDNFGMANVTLSSLAKELGTSHAALYKYFKNKKELWGALAIRWLDEILTDIFEFQPDHYDNQLELIHDWLWAFANSKRKSYIANTEMFALYTAYVDEDAVLLARHINDLITNLTTVSTLSADTAQNLITTFAWFTTPTFAPAWITEDFTGKFDSMWAFIRPSLEAII
ncbi:TetR/AcrR family transcriptional regulator [Lactococcus insecticola]|uniref:TetR family transcriptional regulator n=1 Tax=Pseudolactococcus insecticola TaxID=2709158 RepID=A0A6A0B3I9_9LACT|nr:TetR/AcrR family transcriptional regulator [Lactococcus insecticola]GFH39890.1 TetR family transcriptional regulator [Lactococcus insecticola]